MRLAEFFKSKTSFICRILYFVFFVFYKRLGIRLGFSIPLFTCSKGLSLPHYGTIVISQSARLGEFCRIHTSVNIGANNDLAPTIGSKVYIGPGAKLYGDVVIGSNCFIGANSVVNKSFKEEGWVVAGVPAAQVKKVSLTWFDQNIRK